MPDKKIIEEHPYIRYSKPILSDEEIIKRSASFYESMDGRRSVREFSDAPVPREVIENIIKTASTAPSGAHKQPWTFCVIENPEVKKQIRIAAEEEELESYESRMSSEWLDDLKPLGTDWQKPFLEIAPYLIIVFRRIYEFGPEGKKKNNYYVQESVGLACGFLLAAIHNAGLVSLTHTPSPMNFISKILNRPENEKPFLLIPVGYPAAECWVPDINRKELDEVAIFY
ncbi:nitroreductase family protein [Flavobacterium muglaense]|uniref:Nitroreductase family protein n=1 Tax=Flavobacterium muglaense TaxID=2764716 RepID=A0A923MW78_9FLAO|nr:nitroreductase family protein [Flavobacterium muglaense]MBC5836299.1 nitroreductase family protein [Flavobacterium muglaense]MBC5842829.1 nitroreductase family protein [Flavobacterium muglaense]